MGRAVGGNIGDRHAMFDPTHGSSSPLAGQDNVNPMAMILSVGEGLRWLGLRKADAGLARAAEAIERADVAVLERGEPLTFDLAAAGEAA
jgi:isocitrate/isopropylmalate dehydrogenase